MARSLENSKVNERHTWEQFSENLFDIHVFNFDTRSPRWRRLVDGHLSRFPAIIDHASRIQEIHCAYLLALSISINERPQTRLCTSPCIARHVISNHRFSFFSFRPAYATHALLACYVFLPITKNSHAFVLGLTATMCYLTTLLLITYSNTSNCVAKVNPSSSTSGTTAAELTANKCSKEN